MNYKASALAQLVVQKGRGLMHTNALMLGHVPQLKERVGAADLNQIPASHRDLRLAQEN